MRDDGAIRLEVNDAAFQSLCQHAALRVAEVLFVLSLITGGVTSVRCEGHALEPVDQDGRKQTHQRVGAEEDDHNVEYRSCRRRRHHRHPHDVDPLIRRQHLEHREKGAQKGVVVESHIAVLPAHGVQSARGAVLKRAEPPPEELHARKRGDEHEQAGDHRQIHGLCQRQDDGDDEATEGREVFHEFHNAQ